MNMKTIISDEESSNINLVIESSSHEPDMIYIYTEPREKEATVCIKIEDLKLALRKHSTK